MIEIPHILCPIDFSDHARRALDVAVAIARWYESTVTVLHVSSVTPMAAYAAGPTGLEPIALTSVDRTQLLAEMKRFIDAESAPDVPIDAMLREGNAAGEILSQADDMHVDLLVMGTHGRSGFERLVLGSVTEKVLRKAGCPVLTVPHRHPDAVPAAAGLFKQILCPVDFSDSSTRALNYAMSLAQEADAHLTVLHVLTSDLDDASHLYDTLLDDEDVRLGDVRRRREARADELLRNAVPDTVAAYCTVETMMARGKPGREILRVARERQSDLIVIGVRGRGAADLMFFGSTANQVVREAACPVLTLRGKGA